MTTEVDALEKFDFVKEEEQTNRTEETMIEAIDLKEEDKPASNLEEDASSKCEDPSMRFDERGSQRRLDRLAERRNSVVYGNMWKAHESGFSVSKCARNRWNRLKLGVKVAHALRRSVDDKNDTSHTMGKRPSYVTKPSKESSALAQLVQEAVAKAKESDELSSETIDKTVEVEGQSLEIPKRPVMMRRASQNIYLGEGFEMIPDLDKSLQGEALFDSSFRNGGQSMDDSFLQLAGSGQFHDSVNSKSSSKQSKSGSGKRSSISLLHESAGELNVCLDTVEEKKEDGTSYRHYDTWGVLDEEYGSDYGPSVSFRILGTSADDVDAHPHVLSPPLMESLQYFFPCSKSEDNFWMKYSLLKDGASLSSLMDSAKGAKYTILALETVDGEVFGSFTGEAWHTNWSYYGTGETFIWRMSHLRQTKSCSVIEQGHMESEVEVYPYVGENDEIQLSQQNRLVIGGGSGSISSSDSLSNTQVGSKCPNGGAALQLDGELLHGTSCSCPTFNSPPLSKVHADGSPFEIVNMELWTLTPCLDLGEAECLESRKMFVGKHMRC